MPSHASSTTFDSKHSRGLTRPGLSSRMVMRALESLQVGALDITLPNGSTQRFVGHATEPHVHQPHYAQLHLHDWSVLAVVAARGDIGFGETYMQGLWTTPDLAALLRLVAANRHAMSQMIYGRWWSTLADQIRHLLRSNRKKQARKNISAHYDLGNNFYRLWLDPSMTYSSALFDASGQWGQAVDLEAGQYRKIDRAVSQLCLEAENDQTRVLEIGCGWGGLARRLLDQTAAGYVGLTLSAEQQEWAQQILGKSRLNGRPRAEVRLQDYRDVNEQFDGIISIEMFEAVGERYWDAYFKMLARCLKPDGRAVIQTITIDDRLFNRYRTGTDFIQQYIFPGGMLPSKSVFQRYAQSADLEVEDAFFFGQDYARTLAEWMKTFDAQAAEIEAQGFDARFQRMWRFYLAYCEAGFAEGNIDVGQFTLRRTRK